MSRPVGTPLLTERVKLFVPATWVLRSGKRRYVFMDALQPRIFRISHIAYSSNRLSARFSQLVHRGMYNMKLLYGLTAIDIDQPQKDYAVSVELEIVVGEGQDTTQKASVEAG